MEKKTKVNPKMQWAKFAIVLVLYLLFLYWVGSWWGLLVVPFIYDAYITKKIKWQWWKEEEGPVKWVMSWVDALVFALIAVYFINLFFFQNYVIPSSSLEKSLLTGDYLFVSKVSYGPRIPETPLTMPLTQHTLPVFECKSYLDWPHWDYRRVKGTGKVQLNDIVVFNYPAGDTICNNQPYQTEYYHLCYMLGYQAWPNRPNPDSLSALERRKYYQQVYSLGRQIVNDHFVDFGGVSTRPTDRRENYVKRCVGLPGQTLQIKNRIVYLDGKANKEPDNVQYTYYVKLKQRLPEEMLQELGISMEDLMSLNQLGYMPLTQRAVDVLGARKEHHPQHRCRRGMGPLPPERQYALDARQLRPHLDTQEGREAEAHARQPAHLRAAHPCLRGQHPGGDRRRQNPYQRPADRRVYLQARLLLDARRQPPQQCRQPLLGLRARRPHRG